MPCTIIFNFLGIYETIFVAGFAVIVVVVLVVIFIAHRERTKNLLRQVPDAVAESNDEVNNVDTPLNQELQFYEIMNEGDDYDNSRITRNKFERKKRGKSESEREGKISKTVDIQPALPERPSFLTYQTCH